MLFKLLNSSQNPLISLIFALIFFSALVLTIAVHEWAHAWTANKLGDPTAKLDGRLTLNPLAHLDPLGTVTLLFWVLVGGSRFLLTSIIFLNQKEMGRWFH